jgi:hypothetical protein
MIKNEHSCTNEQLGKVKEDVKYNHDFGSLFQFWVHGTANVLLKEFGVEYKEPPKDVQVDYDKIWNLAIDIVKNIGQ